MELIENGMTVGAMADWERLFIRVNSPWDRRSAQELRQFVYDLGLEEKILRENLDEDCVDMILDDFSEDTAVLLIERYIIDHELVDRFDTWALSD